MSLLILFAGDGLAHYNETGSCGSVSAAIATASVTLIAAGTAASVSSSVGTGLVNNPATGVATNVSAITAGTIAIALVGTGTATNASSISGTAGLTLAGTGTANSVVSITGSGLLDLVATGTATSVSFAEGDATASGSGTNYNETGVCTCVSTITANSTYRNFAVIVPVYQSKPQAVIIGAKERARRTLALRERSSNGTF